MNQRALGRTSFLKSLLPFRRAVCGSLNESQNAASKENNKVYITYNLKDLLLMVATLNGPTGADAAVHAQKEVSDAFEHAPIPHLRAGEQTVRDLDQMKNQGNASYADAQVSKSSRRTAWCVSEWVKYFDKNP